MLKFKIMKNIFKSLLLLFSITTYCQEGVIVPLNSLIYTIPNGTYFKDLDSIFSPLVGIWKGEKYGKELTIELVKFEHHIVTSPNGNYYYQDRLMGKYKVKDIASGIILSSTMAAANYEDYKIFGLGYVSIGRFDLLFTDSICSNNFLILLENIADSPNQLNYVAFYDEYWDYNNCNYNNRDDIPKSLPFKIDIVLTKQ